MMNRMMIVMKRIMIVMMIMMILMADSNVHFEMVVLSKLKNIFVYYQVVISPGLTIFVQITNCIGLNCKTHYSTTRR